MGRYLSEMTAVMSLLAPIDKTGGTVATQGFNMTNYERVMFILSMGNMASTDTVTVTVKGNTASTNGGTAVAGRYRVATSGAAGVSFVDGAVTAFTSSGFTIADGQDNKVYVIEVLAEDMVSLGPTYKYVNINIGSPGAHACLMSLVAVGYNARSPKATSMDPSS